MPRNLSDWVAETPESIAARLEGAREAQRQTRFTLGIMALISMMMLILSYNAYLSFDSRWTLSRRNEAIVALDKAEKVADVLTIQALLDWAASRNATIELLGIQVSVDDAPVLGTSSLFVVSLWLLLVTRRENHTVGTLLRDTDTRRGEAHLSLMSADVDGQESDQSFGQRWLIFHSIVANNVFVAFDASMRRIDSLGGVNPLWTEQAPGWPAALRKWTLTFARGFFFWFPVAVALFVFALDRWSYFDIDPFLPTDKPPGTQAPLFYISGVVFAACWIPLFVCCRISARYSNATGIVVQEYASKLQADLLRRESTRREERLA